MEATLDPALTRYLYIPGYAWLWLATVISLGLFAYRASFFVRALRLGKKDDRFSQMGRRLKQVVLDVGLQWRMRDGIIYPAHLLIFYGFVVYATSFWLTLIKGLVPVLPYPWPDEIAPVAFVMEVWAVLVLLGLAAAAYRRFVIRPEGLKQSADAVLILSLIASLMVTFLLGSTFRLVASGEPATLWTPVGMALAGLFRGMGLGHGAAPALYLAMWWAHILTVLGFLAYLPFSKHLHLLASPFGVYFTDLNPPGRLAGEEAVPAESAPAAAKSIDMRDFTWRESLSALACAECGRCDRACPAYSSGEALSPQKIVHHMKEHLLEAAPRLLAGGGNGYRQLVSGIVKPEEIWACATCGACREQCPVRNEHIPLIVRMRRHLVGEGKVESSEQDVLTSLMRYGNSFSQSERMRPKWTQGLPFKIKDARKEPVEYLWFVGDYASYDPRLQGISRTVAQILGKANVDFGILYEGERNAGNDIRRVGEEGLFELLAEKNIAVLKKCQFKQILTTDPHTYNTLKNEYPTLGASWPVTHYSELLWRLIDTGLLPMKKKVGSRVAYHDPCYLGRYNGIFDAPRRVLGAAGVDLVEMPRSGKDAYCCGAGGGRIWMEDRPGIKERPAESRIREAAALPGVTALVAACPKDLVMFQDAAKTTGNEGKIAVKDLAEIVWAAAA